MPAFAPAYIEEMKVVYHADVRPYKSQLHKYMQAVPERLVIVYQKEENNYCILGTDAAYENWDHYTNYVFPKLETALEFPGTIFRIDDITWQKV